MATKFKNKIDVLRGDELMDLTAVAETVGVCTQTISRWIRSRQIPAPLRFGRRLIRFRRSEIQAWLSGTWQPQNNQEGSKE